MLTGYWLTQTGFRGHLTEEEREAYVSTYWIIHENSSIVNTVDAALWLILRTHFSAAQKMDFPAVTTSSKSFHLNLSRIFWLAWLKVLHQYPWRAPACVARVPQPGYFVCESRAKDWLVLSACENSHWTRSSREFSDHYPGSRPRAQAEQEVEESRTFRTLSETPRPSWSPRLSLALDAQGPALLPECKSIWMQATNLPGEGSREAKAKCSQALKPEASFRSQQLTGEPQH